MPRKYPSMYQICLSDRGNIHLIWGVGAMCAAFFFNCFGDFETQSRVKKLESRIERLEGQIKKPKGNE